MHTYKQNTCIHRYMGKYIHTYLLTYIRTYVHTYIRTYIHTYIHTYVRTYVHTYIRTYIHACIHTHIQTYIPVHTILESGISFRILSYTVELVAQEEGRTWAGCWPEAAWAATQDGRKRLNYPGLGLRGSPMTGPSRLQHRPGLRSAARDFRESQDSTHRGGVDFVFKGGTTENAGSFAVPLHLKDGFMILWARLASSSQ